MHKMAFLCNIFLSFKENSLLKKDGHFNKRKIY
jgi:hypothetical protein